LNDWIQTTQLKFAYICGKDVKAHMSLTYNSYCSMKSYLYINVWYS